MFARALYSRGGTWRPLVVILGAAILLSLLAPAWGVGPHQRRVPKLTSTQRTEYRIVQEKQEKGRETIEKQVFDNNTVVFGRLTRCAHPMLSKTKHRNAAAARARLSRTSKHGGADEPR